MREPLDLGPLDVVPPGEGRTFAVGALRIAVFRTRDDAVYATQASCPHRQGPLADGLLGGSSVVCPLHGFKFDLATGAALGHDCGALAVYPVTVDGGRRIRLRLEATPEEPAKEIAP